MNFAIRQLSYTEEYLIDTVVNHAEVKESL